jgi:hypothetical protein
MNGRHKGGHYQAIQSDLTRTQYEASSKEAHRVPAYPHATAPSGSPDGAWKESGKEIRRQSRRERRLGRIAG